jgi:mono/diheme cytochrome c family protein
VSAKVRRRIWASGLLALAGCGTRPDPGSAAVPEAPAPHVVEAAPAPITALEEAQGASSTVVVARVAGRRLVFVADADEKSVTAVDPDARREVARTPLGAAPSQILAGPDGRLYAALRDEGAVAVLESTGRLDGSLTVRARIATAVEPVALAARGDTLLVVSGWGHRLEAFSMRRRERELAVDLPREPRAVAFSRDGRAAVVSHMVGSVVSVVDLDRREVRRIPLEGGDIAPPLPTFVCGPDGVERPPPPENRETRRSALQGFALARFEERILLPEVLARAGDPTRRTDGYGHLVGELPAHVFDVAVIDAAGERPAYGSTHVQTQEVAARVRTLRDCLLPRGAAVDEARGSLFVACVDIHAVIELDPRRGDPARAEKRRFMVAAGPTGVAVDTAAEEAFAWSQFARALDILPLGDARASRSYMGSYQSIRVPLGEDDLDDGEIGHGRALFHASGDKRIARDGRACASCHPDGRDDGLVWPTPDGPRQPPMLAGRLAGTAPYSWSNGHATVAEHLTTTFKRLGGTGLDARSLAALIAYVTSLPGPRRPDRAGDPEVARGRSLFADPGVGCTACHREEAAFTDGSMHDVSSRALGDASAKFDTPSLRFVGGTAPYFHDGRYASLRALLRAKDSAMGNTGHLGEEDLEALEAYLESL